MLCMLETSLMPSSCETNCVGSAGEQRVLVLQLRGDELQEIRSG